MGVPTVQMYMANRSFWEFLTCRKTDDTKRLETNFIRQF